MDLINEASPHFHSKASTAKIMGKVCVSLIPAVVAATLLFGLGAPVLMLVCISTAMVSEHICCMLMRRESSVGDLSCVVTAMLFSLSLPVSCPYWIAIVGTAFAIIVVKMLFGGIGRNVANPAVAARVFLMVAFPSALATYPHVLGSSLDAVSTATPLAVTGSVPYSYLDMFLGAHAGSMGETSGAALLIGFMFLLVMKVVDAWATLPYLGTVVAISLATGQDALMQLLSGGLLFAAFYMVTDYSTTPMTARGKVIFGIGCGLITALLRLHGSAPGGVAFSILFMNMMVPIIDRYTAPRPIGGVKRALR